MHMILYRTDMHLLLSDTADLQEGKLKSPRTVQ